eukprot:6181015-Pleurochrysis_carterae.AAC.1
MSATTKTYLLAPAAASGTQHAFPGPKWHAHLCPALLSHALALKLRFTLLKPSCLVRPTLSFSLPDPLTHTLGSRADPQGRHPPSALRASPPAGGRR